MWRRRAAVQRSLPPERSVTRPPTAEGVNGSAPVLHVPGFGDLLVASAAAVIAALLLRLVLNVATPAEIFGDRITVLIPLPIFSTFLRVLGPLAKHLYFGGLLLGEWVGTAVASLVYLRLRAAARKRGLPVSPGVGPLDLVALPLWLWLLSAGLLAPIIGVGFFGAALPGGVALTFLSQVVPGLACAAVLLWLSRRPERATASMPDSALSRRRLLRQGATALAIVAGGALAWEALSSGLLSLFSLSRSRVANVSFGGSPTRIVPPPAPNYGPWTSVTGLSPDVTSPSEFYYVSKNVVGDPQIASASWQLSILGRVSSPYSLSYTDLLTLPRVEQYHTLECISNEVGGNLISNGLFTGTHLSDLLNHAGIQAGASEMIFHAADGYSDSLHLSQALHPDALIVYLLDGLPLPQPHGFPARLLIPGLYGMKNGKWLTSLEVGAGGYTGYWEQQGWTREARVKLMSRIDVPREGDVLAARPSYVAGIAYSGDQGIARVDVSMDRGQTWHTATLRRPLGTLTWVLWEYLWTPSVGQIQIIARAVDLQGNVQSPAYADPLPDGASGYNAVNVTVG